jgi:hypothetical protein
MSIEDSHANTKEERFELENPIKDDIFGDKLNAQNT